MTGEESGSHEADRRGVLATRLAAVRERIARACADAGRDPAGVHLIAVTKFFPATDLAYLHDLGVRDVGESRDQEAGPKLRELAGLDPAARSGLRVHFVGQVQTNKAASVAGYADVVHSVDRARLVTALAKGAARAGRRLDVLIQVDLDEAGQGGQAGQGGDRGPETRGGRGGATPDAIPALAERIAATGALRLAGLMAVAPLGAEPRAAFERLRRIHERLRRDHPEADVLSAGMSQDLETAIACGATHLRVGTAILGSRPAAR